LCKTIAILLLTIYYIIRQECHSFRGGPATTWKDNQHQFEAMPWLNGTTKSSYQHNRAAFHGSTTNGTASSAPTMTATQMNAAVQNTADKTFAELCNQTMDAETRIHFPNIDSSFSPSFEVRSSTSIPGTSQLPPPVPENMMFQKI